ncbi:MAG: MFS transporter [Dehalococcoidia bacterium]|nr:MFS transporter [Dehalococcoidia bacterium]
MALHHVLVPAHAQNRRPTACSEHGKSFPKLILTSNCVSWVSSVLGGAAPNVYVLIVARMLQAIGGGAMLPSATSIVSDAFGERRATFIGLFTTIFPLGGVIGPNIGGFVIDHYSWRWLFFANGPVGAAIFVAGLLLIQKQSRNHQKRKIDVIGVGLFSGGLMAILSAMTAWGNDPQLVQNPLTWMGVVLGVVLLAVFVWHEGRTPAPIIEIKLLRWRPYFAANLYSFIYGAAVFGFFSFIPYYATVAYGMTAAESGIILTPRSLAMMGASALSSFVLIRWGYRLPMILGVAFTSSSLLLLSQGFRDWTVFNVQVPNLVLMSVVVLLAGCGMGIAGPPSANVALDLMPDKVAAVVGLRGMFRSTGGVFGTAIIILALSHVEDKAAGMQTIFLVLSVVVLLVVPVVFMMPDTARQRRVAARNQREQDSN